MARAKPALVVATSAEIQCPYCGDALVNPRDESTLWLSEQIEQLASSADAERVCAACDTPYRVRTQRLVGMPLGNRVEPY